MIVTTQLLIPIRALWQCPTRRVETLGLILAVHRGL